RQQIATVYIGAQPMLEIGRSELRIGQRILRIRGNERPENCQQNDPQTKPKADQRGTIPAETAPGLLIWAEQRLRVGFIRTVRADGPLRFSHSWRFRLVTHSECADPASGTISPPAGSSPATEPHT